MKLKELIKLNEAAVDDAKQLYKKNEIFKKFVMENSRDYDVPEKYIKLYKTISDAFEYLTWLEIFHHEEPDTIPVEEYNKEKNDYQKTLDKFAGRF